MTNRATEVRLKGNGESGDDWPWVRLGDVCSIGRGRVISKPYINQNSGPYPVCSSQTQDEGVFGSIDTYDFEGEWVTWTTDGANARRVFYRNGRFNCTNVCGTIKPHDDKVIHLPFLAIALNELTKPHVMIASGNPKLMNNVVKNIRVPLPPLPEQKRIAGILKEQLAAVERARAAAEAQLEAAKALPAAYLRDVFEAEDATTWPSKRIGEFAKVQSGYAFNKRLVCQRRHSSVAQCRRDSEPDRMGRRCLFTGGGTRALRCVSNLRVNDVVLTLDRPIVSNGAEGGSSCRSRTYHRCVLQRVGRFKLFGNIDPSYLLRISKLALASSSKSPGVIRVWEYRIFPANKLESVKLPVPEICTNNAALASAIEDRRERADTLRNAITRATRGD